MAKNKAPRKPYRKRPERCFCATKEDLDDIKDQIVHTALAAELALPAGTASPDDVACINSLFNHALVGLVGRDYLDEGERAEAAKIIDEAGKALDVVVQRGKARGEMRFVFTGDELNLVRDAVAVAQQFINDSLDVQPHRTLMEFFVMKLLMKRNKTKDVETKQVHRALDELARMPTYKWRQI